MSRKNPAAFNLSIGRLAALGLMLFMAGTASAQSAINYLVFSYTATSLWANPPSAALATSATVRIQSSCPAGSPAKPYGYSGMSLRSYSANGSAGALSASGSYCVAGVPSTVRLKASSVVGGGTLTLNLTDTAATALTSYFESSINGSASGTALINSSIISILLPDASVLLTIGYDHTDPNIFYYYGIAAGSVAVSGGGFKGVEPSVSFGAIGLACNGCGNSATITYQLGY